MSVSPCVWVLPRYLTLTNGLWVRPCANVLQSKQTERKRGRRRENIKLVKPMCQHLCVRRVVLSTMCRDLFAIDKRGTQLQNQLGGTFFVPSTTTRSISLALQRVHTTRTHTHTHEMRAVIKMPAQSILSQIPEYTRTKHTKMQSTQHRIYEQRAGIIPFFFRFRFHYFRTKDATKIVPHVIAPYLST